MIGGAFDVLQLCHSYALAARYRCNRSTRGLHAMSMQGPPAPRAVQSLPSISARPTKGPNSTSRRLSSQAAQCLRLHCDKANCVDGSLARMQPAAWTGASNMCAWCGSPDAVQVTGATACGK